MLSPQQAERWTSGRGNDQQGAPVSFYLSRARGTDPRRVAGPSIAYHLRVARSTALRWPCALRPTFDAYGQGGTDSRGGVASTVPPLRRPCDGRCCLTAGIRERQPLHLRVNGIPFGETPRCGRPLRAAHGCAEHRFRIAHQMRRRAGYLPNGSSVS